MDQRTTDIENNDAEKFRNALRAMAQNDFSRARCLLQEVVLNTPENYIYSYEEGDTLFVRFWTEDEFMHFVVRPDGQRMKREVSWIPAIYPPAYYYLAHIDNEEGKYESAIAHLETCLKLEPDQPACFCEMAVAYSGMGDHEKALSFYDKGIQARPHITSKDRARALRGKGFALIDLGELDLAKKSLLESLRYEPNSEIALNELMLISLLRTGATDTLPPMKLTRKDYFLKRICSSCGKDLEATEIDEFKVFKMGNKFIFFCSACGANETLEKGMDAKRDYATAYYNMGGDLVESGNLQEAVEAFKRAISFRNDYAEAYFGLGWAYSKLEGYQQAIEAYKEAIRIRPGFGEAHFYLALTYHHLGHRQDAIEAIGRAIQINPDYLEAYRLSFSINLTLGNYQEVLKALEQVIRIKPDEAEAHNYLGITYSTLKDHQRAVESFKQAIHLNPDYVEAYLALGESYNMLNQYNEAINAFREAIRLRPDEAEACCGLGTSYCLLNYHQEAIEFLKQAIHLNPDYAEAYISLGNSYSMLGQHQNAMEAAKEAVRIQPDRPDAHYNLGELYLVLGDTISAVKEFEILKRLDETGADLLLSLIGKGKLDRVYDWEETQKMRSKKLVGNESK